MNHTTGECYSKHGFPPWMKQKRDYTANSFEKEEENETDKNKVMHDETLSEQIIRTFGSDQLQQFIDIMQVSKNKEKIINNTMTNGSRTSRNVGKEGNGHWILDMGVIDDVTCYVSSFINYYQINLVKVKLPNNCIVIASHALNRNSIQKYNST